MLATTYCQTFLKKALPFIHSKRVATLTCQVSSLLNNADLTLTSLARHYKGPAKMKHKINMTWRFLTNSGVDEDSVEIYRGIANTYLQGIKNIRIAVDWSGCCGKENYILRASLLHKGRSITLYNEIHPAHKQEDEEVQTKFLNKLAHIVPEGCSVILVTDAGFKTAWFHQIATLGWYYVGRVRGRIHCKLGDGGWEVAKELHKKLKRGETHFLGMGKLGKTTKTQQEVCFIGHFGNSKGRKKPKKSAKYPDAEKTYSSLNAEPWIIATNLCSEWVSKGQRTPAQAACIIRNIYKKRMQIEQNFRDDKNPRFGLGWRYSRTRDRLKISVLCLIATIASLILWLLGFSAEAQGLHYEFQANTVRTHRVLSYAFLAKQVLMHALHRLKINNLDDAIRLFHSVYEDQFMLGI